MVTYTTNKYSTDNLMVEGDCSEGRRHLHKFYVRTPKGYWQQYSLKYISSTLSIDHSYLSHIFSPHNPKTGSPLLISRLARFLQVRPSELVSLLKELGKGSADLEGIWEPEFLTS